MGIGFPLMNFTISFKACPVLNLLSLNEPAKTTRLITLPHVETLKLYGFETTNSVLEIFTTPRLKTLHLYRDFNRETVVEFLQRSRCLLEEFRIHIMCIDDIWQIQELKGIKKLYWADPRCCADGLDWLTIGNAHGVEDLFPSLEILDVYGIEVEAMQDLTGMLTSRLPQVHLQLPEIIDHPGDVHFLTSVHITFDMDLGADDIGRLKEFLQSDVLRQSGVEMLIDNYGETILKSM
ncbi:hypothetical protein BDQ17DRAFT_481583 [Cyathus striatus]|nr:hypothetical protein BDQ17DRAFT_481583 [Cyathus striatus]